MGKERNFFFQRAIKSFLIINYLGTVMKNEEAHRQTQRGFMKITGVLENPGRTLSFMVFSACIHQCLLLLSI